ncbi:PREDICTED: uncharacterized protein LOC104756952 [Camelina sativa]|uniref:Uncharacterized protein LOC104756952 n=1 Tax=Camelina sativa TaxID=90675 RepID=A0ABM0WYC9_CAMSA|nr:PREDICTED: uncharacterized protein LOC104756952 [Camelina sativa]
MTSRFRYPAFPSGSMKEASPEEAVAVRAVFWDMDKCPLPDGFDPCRVRPCIKQCLEEYGYHGPFSILAFGVLDKVPNDILRGVYSTGIALTNIPDCDFMNTLSFICDFTIKNPRPATIIALSDPDLEISNYIRRYKGYNLLQPKFCDLLASSDSVVPEEETSDSPYWECLVCRRDPPSQGFDNFTAHLSTEEHQEMILSWLPNPPRCVPSAPLDSHPANVTFMEPLDQSSDQEEAVLTKVLWDINKCPVPHGFNPRLVGPCIKRFLESSRYPGPFSIVAIGLLSDVPEDTLRAVSSTGIVVLHNVANGSAALQNTVFELALSRRPPLNIIVITPMASDLFLHNGICNVDVRDTLGSVLLADSAALEEEDKGNETGESACWFCSVCCHGHAFQGYENLTTHLSGRAHQRKMLDWLPRLTNASNAGSGTTSQSARSRGRAGEEYRIPASISNLVIPPW